MQKYTKCILAGLFLYALSGYAQPIRSYSIEVSCKTRIYNSTQSILEFKWPYRSPGVDTQRVYRKNKHVPTWGPQYRVLRKYDSTFNDTITTGASFEYKFEKDSGYDGYTVIGYILAGARANAIINRGKILLIIDSTHKTFLDTVLRRYRNDLIGDGWKTEVKWVDTATTVAQIKSYIVGRHSADPTVKSVVLIGNVAVPYSGDYSASGESPPDGHTTGNSPGASHEGAWPADCYYADVVNATWPDVSVNNTLGTRPENDNVPSDGKFDYTYLTNTLLQLQVGRIDLSDMPAFSLNERQLLKQYFNKNHDFRHKIVTIRERCLVDDGLGVLNYGVPGLFHEHFASNAYRNMAPLISDTVTYNLDYRTTLNTNDYLWSFGFGTGSYVNCSGIGTTSQLASSSQTIKSVFSGFMGSYFGDWDNQNNFLRAPLAASGNVLNTFWCGRPHWFFHHMGLGETIGYSTLRTQSNLDTVDFNLLYPTPAFSYLLIHPSLMGDPSVRMQPVEPAHNLLARQDSCNLQFRLRWNASSDTAVHSYYVFRAKHIDSAFSLLGTTRQLYYIDASPLTGNNVYMIRGEKLQLSGSGSYFNLSQGIFDTISTSEFNIPVAFTGSDTDICAQQRIRVGSTGLNNASTIYTWTPGAYTTDTVNFIPVASGNISVITTDTVSGCIKMDTMALTVNALPVNEVISDNGNLCSDTVNWSSSLNNGAGFNYSWNFQGAISYNVSGHMQNAPGLVMYTGLGTYLTTLTVRDTLTLCSQVDSQLVNVTCVSLPVEGININCINTINGKQISFIVYDNENYAAFQVEGLLGDKWQSIKQIVMHSSMNYNLLLEEGGPDYVEIRISGIKPAGETKILDNCYWQTQANEVNIFPNPVHDQLLVNYSGTSGNKSCSITVYNPMGVEILLHDFHFLQNTFAISTHDLAAGVYLARIMVGDKSWTYKFVKE